MVRRTYPDDVEQISEAADLENVVKDKRAAWRAGDARARRRQRRYKNLLTRQFQRGGLGEGHDDDSS
ncbi:MAG: hypothetical protein ACXIUB_06885 [Wenzhouxiangella sp.]